MNIFTMYPIWTCILWWSIIALAVAIEILGLFRWHGAIPLTWVIRDTLPTWLRWTIMGFLLYHFGVLTNSTQPLK